MTDIRLVEGGSPTVVTLTEQAGTALGRSDVVKVVRLGSGRWEVTSRSKVGAATVAGVTVWIRPKVDVRRILFLLGYAKNPGWRDDLVEMIEASDLVPAMGDAFATLTERALDRGVLHGYVNVEGSLAVLRGRLRQQDQLRQRFGVALPVLVRYDDHVVDIPENQLLRGATEALLRLPGVRPRTRTRLRRLRHTLTDVTSPPPGRPLPSWSPNRLNERYHLALMLAAVILRGNAVDQEPGDIRIGGFLVNMAKVYEDFLTVALTEAFRPHGGWCLAQDRHHLDVGKRVAMDADLVWYRDGDPAAVIDAKYKAEKPAGFPNADVYQMLAYCTALQLPHGHLIYAKGNASEGVHEVGHADITIHTHTVDLDTAPRDLLAQIDTLALQIVATSRPGISAHAVT